MTLMFVGYLDHVYVLVFHDVLHISISTNALETIETSVNKNVASKNLFDSPTLPDFSSAFSELNFGTGSTKRWDVIRAEQIFNEGGDLC